MSRFLAMCWMLTACGYASRAPELTAHALTVPRVAAKGPLARSYEQVVPPSDVTPVHYPSRELELQAYVLKPASAGGDAPTLVYFHGDFALHTRDLIWCRPFVEAGFVVMLPTLRAENGNPGDFELLDGEVDDALAAVRWLSAQPGVDPQRVFTLGHSVGGALSALLSLRDEAQVVATASIGGVYVPGTFARWAAREQDRDLIRFDPTDPRETERRVLGPQVASMVHPHVAFIGRDDSVFASHAQQIRTQAAAVGAPFSYQMVEGDHMTSVPHAISAYIGWIERQATFGTTHPE